MSPVPNPRRLEQRERARRMHWWRRRSWSMLVLVLVVAVMGALAFRSALDVGDALPEVGKDAQGEDPWTDPIGVERAGEFTLARIPDCAAGPVVKIALWNEASEPYWEVTGPPTPMTTFVVGVTPEGFTETVPYRQPEKGALLRLVVIRRLKGAAGVRYRDKDLRTSRVVAQLPLTRFTEEGFQSAELCGKDGDGKTDSTVTTIAG